MIHQNHFKIKLIKYQDAHQKHIIISVEWTWPPKWKWRVGHTPTIELSRNTRVFQRPIRSIISLIHNFEFTLLLCRSKARVEKRFSESFLFFATRRNFQRFSTSKVPCDSKKLSAIFFTSPPLPHGADREITLVICVKSFIFRILHFGFKAKPSS